MTCCSFLHLTAVAALRSPKRRECESQVKGDLKLLHLGYILGGKAPRKHGKEMADARQMTLQLRFPAGAAYCPPVL